MLLWWLKFILQGKNLSDLEHIPLSIYPSAAVQLPSHVRLYDPKNCSTPGFPVPHFWWFLLKLPPRSLLWSPRLTQALSLCCCHMWLYRAPLSLCLGSPSYFTGPQYPVEGCRGHWMTDWPSWSLISEDPPSKGLNPQSVWCTPVWVGSSWLMQLVTHAEESRAGLLRPVLSWMVGFPRAGLALLHQASSTRLTLISKAAWKGPGRSPRSPLHPFFLVCVSLKPVCHLSALPIFPSPPPLL